MRHPSVPPRSPDARPYGASTPIFVQAGQLHARVKPPQLAAFSFPILARGIALPALHFAHFGAKRSLRRTYSSTGPGCAHCEAYFRTMRCVELRSEYPCHLRAISALEEGVAVTCDIAADFAMLCSNCHRMIHRYAVRAI